LQNLAVYIFGGSSWQFPETIKQNFITSVPSHQFGPDLHPGVANRLDGGCCGSSSTHTRMGRAIRATAENHETAALLGVDVNRVVLVTFMIGSGIAGVAGVLDGPSRTAGHLAIHGPRRGGQGLIVIAGLADLATCRAPWLRPAARPDRNPVGRLYRHHRGAICSRS